MKIKNLHELDFSSQRAILGGAASYGPCKCTCSCACKEDENCNGKGGVLHDTKAFVLFKRIVDE